MHHYTHRVWIYVTQDSYVTPGSGLEELPHVQGQGRRPRGATRGPRLGVAAERIYSTPEARGGGREEQHHVQGAVAGETQDHVEELFHIQSQEGKQWEDIPRPR